MIEGAPAISGTVVIDLDGNALLGMIEGKQIVGISPDGSEIYTHDNSVISTATHQETSVLPFDQEIPSNAFLASPDGSTLYSREQRVDTETNTLLDDLPVDITTGRYSWGGATKPATPAISADGTTIYALAIDNLKTIDTRANTVASTSVTLTQAYIGDLALSPDETRILLSDYSYGGGRLRVYDAETFELIDSVSTLGDFVGEIAFSQDGKRALVGSAGNPTSIGRISVIDMDTVTVLNHVQLHLADNLDTSGRDQFFVSSGDRSGIDVYVLDPSSALIRTESFFLGINRYAYSRGNPKNDQIRRIVYKGVHKRYLPILFGAYVTPISARTERR
jgi:DNA-binding beta-propeller fold protein YncE